MCTLTIAVEEGFWSISSNNVTGSCILGLLVTRLLMCVSNSIT